MKRYLNKKFFNSIISVGAIIIPLTLTSCYSSPEKINFVTTYDNVLDDAIALGIKPEYATPGNWTTYTSKYIKDIATNAGTKILDWQIYPKNGGSLNPKKLTELGVDVLAANITDSVKENQVENYVNSIAYSGRGDSREFSYIGDSKAIGSMSLSDTNINNLSDDIGGIDFYDDSGKRVWIKDNQYVNALTEGSSRVEKDFIDYGFKYKLYEWQQNPFAALNILADSLDNLSGGKNNFVSKSKAIEDKQKNRLTELNNNEQIKNLVNNKTIAFILGKKASKDSKDTDKNIQLYSPHTYPQFYSKLDNKGLKMNFPTPKDVTKLTKSAMFNDPDIIAGGDQDTNTFKNASGGAEIISQFTGKFDYVVYMAYDAGEYTHSQEEVISSRIKELLKNSSNSSDVSKNIFYTSYSDMYMSTWGPIGQSYGLTKFVEWVNSSLITEESNKIAEKKDYILYNNIDVSQLQYWKNLV